MAQNTPAQPALNWTVVGQGAIGLLAACRLQLAQVPVSLWLRQGLSIDTRYHNKTLRFTQATGQLNAVLLPVKSYAVVDAVHQLLPHLSPDAQLVLSHNGMGTIEQVLPLLQPRQGLWFLTTTHGALKQGATIVHTGKGESVMAPLNDAAQAQAVQVFHAMDCALGPLTLACDITPFLWQKLAINAAINPLTALHNCRNGELAQAEFQLIITAVLEEVCQVADAAGVTLTLPQLKHKVQQVIGNTAQNYSSMQQDVAHQRRTEIDAINGFVVQQAQRYGIAVPHNNSLLQQVRQLQPNH